jgi:hypothetical protein
VVARLQRRDDAAYRYMEVTMTLQGPIALEMIFNSRHLAEGAEVYVLGLAELTAGAALHLLFVRRQSNDPESMSGCVIKADSHRVVIEVEGRRWWLRRSDEANVDGDAANSTPRRSWKVGGQGDGD